MNVGSDEFCITSPLHSDVTLHLPTGDLRIRAVNNGPKNVYIRSMEIDGKPYHRCFITHAALLAAKEIVFYMDSEPSDFGTGTDARPSSWTQGAAIPAPMVDLTESAGICASADVSALHDNSTITELTAVDGTLCLTYTFEQPRALHILTVACGKETEHAPHALHLEASPDPDGDTFITLDSRTALQYEFPHMIKPYALPQSAPYYRYRLTLSRTDSTPMDISEIELIGK
jgi:hypothetical protein